MPITTKICILRGTQQISAELYCHEETLITCSEDDPKSEPELFLEEIVNKEHVRASTL